MAAARREIARIEQTIRAKDGRVLDEYGDPQAYLKRINRVEGAPPILERRHDDRRLHDMALETAPRRRILSADRRGSVLIWECTSDIGVHVHRNAISMCAPALRYVAGCLAVMARPPERRRCSGAFGRDREHPGGLACARPCQPSAWGRSRSISPLREGRQAPGKGVCRAWWRALGRPQPGLSLARRQPTVVLAAGSEN